jgi:hypothetical protein
MRHLIILISTLIFVVCLANPLFGQVDSIRKFYITNYTSRIDSLINKDDKQMTIVKSIAEGQISQETLTTQITGHHNKIDTIRNKIYGGWSKSIYQNTKGDTVYKIVYHDNLQKNFYFIFYYEGNLLLLSKLEYQENGIGQTFYKKEEYYLNGQIIYSFETQGKIEEVYKSRADVNLYLKGIEYYKEFLKGNNSR